MDPVINFHPKISIIIPVYNGEKYLREAVDSALAQTYDNCEIIVINDGSTDGTETIARNYENKIKYYKKENGGQSSALNFGISKMEGEYFSWLCHDDIYYPQKIERQVMLLGHKSDKFGCVYSNCIIIDKNGMQIGKEKIVGEGKINPSFYLLAYRSYNGNSLLIPKDTFNKVGLFNEKRPLTSDVEMFFNLGLIYPFYFIDEYLVGSRFHEDQITFKRYSDHQNEINLFLIDSINRLTDNDLVRISNGKDLNSVVLSIAKIWSKAGHKNAYKKLIERFEKRGLNSVMSFFVLRLECWIFYVWKSLKRYIKRLRYNY